MSAALMLCRLLALILPVKRRLKSRRRLPDPRSRSLVDIMPNYLALPIGEGAPNEINAVIEIARGDTNKYEYDKELNVFRLDRNLYSPVHYPGDYGFIPSTLSDDGDPLYVLVLVDAPSFTGCVMTVRPIGALMMLDQQSEDEKILAVGVNNPIYENVNDYTELYPHLLLEIEHFFSVYKELEAKRTRIKGWEDAERARKLVSESQGRYREKSNN